MSAKTRMTRLSDRDSLIWPFRLTDRDTGLLLVPPLRIASRGKNNMKPIPILETNTNPYDYVYHHTHALSTAGTDFAVRCQILSVRVTVTNTIWWYSRWSYVYLEWCERQTTHLTGERHASGGVFVTVLDTRTKSTISREVLVCL